jgi:hypothetical protein
MVSSVRKHALPIIGAMKIGDVHQRHVIEMITKLKDDKKSASVIRHTRESLAVLFQHALAEGGTRDDQPVP